MKWEGWVTVQALIIGGMFTAMTKIAWDWWKERNNNE